MDELERDFLQTQDHQPLLWLKYIDDIFFTWTHGEKKIQRFLGPLNKFHPNTKYKHESSKEKLSEGQLETDLYIKPADRHQIYTSLPLILSTLNSL